LEAKQGDTLTTSKAEERKRKGGLYSYGGGEKDETVCFRVRKRGPRLGGGGGERGENIFPCRKKALLINRKKKKVVHQPWRHGVLLGNETRNLTKGGKKKGGRKPKTRSSTTKKQTKHGAVTGINVSSSLKEKKWGGCKKGKKKISPSIKKETPSSGGGPGKEGKITS